jgi:hypothetical protein
MNTVNDFPRSEAIPEEHPREDNELSCSYFNHADVSDTRYPEDSRPDL